MRTQWTWQKGDASMSPKWTAAEKETIAATFGKTVEEVEATLEDVKADDFFFNDLYQVHLRRRGDIIHLSIRQRKNLPIRDWRDFQRIKNELVGPEHEAVELFPAESRLIDTANQYHLWVAADPAYRFPFGFAEGRKTLSESMGGAKQRPLDEAHTQQLQILDQEYPEVPISQELLKESHYDAEAEQVRQERKIQS